MPARERSRVLAEALADKLGERDRKLMRACEIANRDPGVQEIEREFDEFRRTRFTSHGSRRIRCRLSGGRSGGLPAPDPTVGFRNSKDSPRHYLTAKGQSATQDAGGDPPVHVFADYSTARTVPVMCAGKPAVAVVDQIRAVSRERLDRRIGAIAADDSSALEEALRDVLEL